MVARFHPAAGMFVSMRLAFPEVAAGRMFDVVADAEGKGGGVGHVALASML